MVAGPMDRRDGERRSSRTVPEAGRAGHPDTGTRPRMQLSVIDGPNAGGSLEIRKNRVIIGRGRADLRLRDPRVADQHCIVEIVGGRFHLRELEGASGVWVNGHRRSRVWLQGLEEISIGGTRMRFSPATERMDRS